MNKKRKNKIIRNTSIIIYLLLTSLICSIINLSYVVSLIIIILEIHIPVVIERTKNEKNKDINKTSKNNYNGKTIAYSNDIKKEKELSYSNNTKKEKVKIRVRKK